MSQTETAKTANLTGTVHTSPEDIPVKDVARLMTARGIGSVVVVDKKAMPIGIVTDRDIVVRVTAPGLDAHATLVGSVMSKPLVTITKSQDIGTAVGVMARHGIRRLPVVDEAGRLASILTLDDILRFKLADPAELTEIVRTHPQSLAPEPGIKAPVIPPAQTATGAFDTGLAFKPSVEARPLAAVAKASAVVPMVKRRRRRTVLEEVRHTIFINRNWVMALVGMILGIFLLVLLTRYMAAQFDANVKDHYQPKDEERRTYQESHPAPTKK